MFKRSILAGLALGLLSLPALSDPVRPGDHRGDRDRDHRGDHDRDHRGDRDRDHRGDRHNPRGWYHHGFRGHHHNWQSWWRPWVGHHNPGGYVCVAFDSEGREFRGYGWDAGENAIDNCYQYSWNPYDCEVKWCN